MKQIALAALAAALGTGALLGSTAAQAGGYGYDAPEPSQPAPSQAR